MSVKDPKLGYFVAACALGVQFQASFALSETLGAVFIALLEVAILTQAVRAVKVPEGSISTLSAQCLAETAVLALGIARSANWVTIGEIGLQAAADIAGVNLAEGSVVARQAELG